MLGFVTLEGRGAADRLLTEVAARLSARGWSLAGAVQQNPENETGRRSHMDLSVLGADDAVRISEDLGALARGCRLDVSGLETAVGRAMAVLERPVPTRFVIVNKFGKQEAEGRGFRPFIAEALMHDIPVLTSVAVAYRPDFMAFAGEIADEVEPTLEAVLDWAEAAVSEALS